MLKHIIFILALVSNSTAFAVSTYNYIINSFCEYPDELSKDPLWQDIDHSEAIDFLRKSPTVLGLMRRSVRRDLNDHAARIYYVDAYIPMGNGIQPTWATLMWAQGTFQIVGMDEAFGTIEEALIRLKELIIQGLQEQIHSEPDDEPLHPTIVFSESDDEPLQPPGHSLSMESNSSVDSPLPQPSMQHSHSAQSNSSAPMSVVAPVPECSICWNAPISHAAIPCGHLTFCAGCAKKEKQCPICRAMMTSVQKIYPP